ncbi:MAG: nuclear transport factor 2 family protein [Conexibacter sp.]|nr:nuclear transport factor 2 family protein [Conexibacter sp.]
MTTDTITNVVDTYISAWNERVPERRRALVAAAFADDATYVDPARAGNGANGIDAMIGGAQEDMPGVEIVLAGAPDAFGEHVRFTWHLRAARGEDVVLIGHDYATVAPDGRLIDVVGFVEPPAA